MGNPVIIAEFKDGSWDIKFKDWSGISPAKLEELAYKIHKADHIERARRLKEFREAEIKAAEVVAPVGNDNDFLKELANALEQNKQTLA